MSISIPKLEKKNNAGTWFLSYLTEIGVLDADDSIEGNCVSGKLLMNLDDIPAGHYVIITMTDGKTLDIISSDNNEDDDDNTPWFERAGVMHTTKTVSISFQ